MSDTPVNLQAYACGNRDQPLLTQTIGDFFDDMAQRMGEHEALVVRHQNARLSYAELKREVDRLASAMLRSGLRKGDRVGIWAHNCVEWVLMRVPRLFPGGIL